MAFITINIDTLEDAIRAKVMLETYIEMELALKEPEEEVENKKAEVVADTKTKVVEDTKPQVKEVKEIETPKPKEVTNTTNEVKKVVKEVEKEKTEDIKYEDVVAVAKNLIKGLSKEDNTTVKIKIARSVNFLGGDRALNSLPEKHYPKMYNILKTFLEFKNNGEINKIKEYPFK